MKKFLHLLIVLLISSFGAPSAWAQYTALIDYSGTNHYAFNFKVANASPDSSTASLDSLGIYLEGDLTGGSNLNWIDSRGWAQFQQDPLAFGRVGYVGATALGVTGVAQNAYLDNFKFEFNYDGPAAVDDQVFSFGAPHGDDSAVTIIAENPVSPAVVPEPGSLLLVGTGIIGVLCAVRRRREK